MSQLSNLDRELLNLVSAAANISALKSLEMLRGDHFESLITQQARARQAIAAMAAMDASEYEKSVFTPLISSLRRRFGAIDAAKREISLCLLELSTDGKAVDDSARKEIMARIQFAADTIGDVLDAARPMLGELRERNRFGDSYVNGAKVADCLKEPDNDGCVHVRTVAYVEHLLGYRAAYRCADCGGEWLLA